jgi:predicted component of type VI protein secretion system
MPKLTVTSGPGAGRSLELEAEVVVGREDADLTIPDPEISRRHATLRPEGQGVVIEDLGSTNGTFVDGRQISGPVTVTTGATIKMGDSELALELPLDTTRVAQTPTLGGGQPTRAAGVVAPGAPPPTAEAVPPKESAPAAAPAAPAAPGRSRPPWLLVGLGVLALVAVAAVAGVLLLGGGSDETKTHDLRANVTTLPLGDPTSFQVSGVLQGEPLGRVAAVFQRRLPLPPTPGGQPVPLRGFILVTAPKGNLALDFNGTLALTKSGGETVSARAIAGNGTGDYEGVKGSVQMTGGRSNAKSPTARYRLVGKLEY